MVHPSSSSATHPCADPSPPWSETCRKLGESCGTIHTVMGKTDAQITQIEKSMLDFYYQHAMHAERNPEWVSDAPRRSSAHQSDISRLLEEKHATANAFRAEYDSKLQTVQALEQHIEKDILQGSLASQKELLSKEEQELKAFEEHLHSKEGMVQQLQLEMYAEETVQLTVQKSIGECAARKRKLEETKMLQMENVDALKRDLEETQGRLKRAQTELQRRELNIQHLKDLIVERENQNKRRGPKH